MTDVHQCRKVDFLFFFFSFACRMISFLLFSWFNYRAGNFLYFLSVTTFVSEIFIVWDIGINIFDTCKKYITFLSLSVAKSPDFIGSSIFENSIWCRNYTYPFQSFCVSTSKYQDSCLNVREELWYSKILLSNLVYHIRTVFLNIFDEFSPW